MATMNISLPDTLKSYIENRVANDGYGNTSEYFRELVRQDQRRIEEERQERAHLEQLKEDVHAGLEALRAGKFREYESTEALIEDIKKEGNRRLAERRTEKN